MTVFFDYILGELRLKDTSGGGSVGSLEAIQIDQSGGTSDTYGVLSGTINGSNTLFTVSKSEYITGTLRVFLNGQLQTQGSAEDWVETTPASGTFTFNIAPQTGDEITVAYNYPATGVIDSLVVNNLSVNSTASINVGYFNKIYASTISTGNLTSNNIVNASTISTNFIYTNNAIISNATIGTAHISNVEWNLTSGATVALEGQMNWDSVQQSVVVGLAGGNVDVALGMENVFPRRVRNSTGSTMPKGTAVYINGVSGNTPTVQRAIATSDMTSAYTLGLTAESIADGATGWVTTFGELTNIDLSSFTAGNTLYLSGATAGYYTNTRPYAPTHYVRLGTVVKATADGILVVNVINGFETDELHDVSITSLASGQILQSGVSSLWYNRSLASAVADLNVLASLGSLAVMNQLSFTSLTNQPSLGSLAEMNALSFTSLLNQPSLSSLAFQSTVDYLTQITNLPSLGSLAVMNQLAYGSLLSSPSLNGDYLRLDLSNVPVTGGTFQFSNLFTANINVQRSNPSQGSIGRALVIAAGGAEVLSTNRTGGNLSLSAGTATGNQGSDIAFLTATPGLSGTTDRTPSTKMTIKGSGNVGIGTTTPSEKLSVSGNGTFTGNLSAANLSGTNTGDTYDSIFGDGSDGYVILDGTEYLDFATYNSGTTTYTLIRDVYALGLTIQTGVIVNTAGYRIFCADYFTNNGTVQNNGGNASSNTAGTGAAGGFFKAGGNGAAGIASGGVAAVGAAPAAVTGLVGGIGGRGAVGRLAATTNAGNNISVANAARPSAANGSSKVANGMTAYLYPYLPSGLAANIQLQPSVGGGGGAKSATGTAAASGGGGGGGGVVFIAARTLSNNGTIQANGGNGGNASGTGGNFGGGGGGGGGVVALVYQPTKGEPLNTTVQALGGTGGTSVSGTNGTIPVASADATTTGTTNLIVRLLPTETPSLNTLLMLSGVMVGGYISSIQGYGLFWEQVNYENFNTIASPTRSLNVWKGYYNTGTIPNVVDYPYIQINLGGTPTSTRFILDYIENTLLNDGTDPIAGNAVASSDSTNNLTTDLGYTPTTGNMQYSVFARVGGSAPAQGTGQTTLNNQNALPYLYSCVAISRQTNNHLWTTATAAAGITVDINQPASAENGADGWEGKTVFIWA